ncbi:unnamed protein product [Moneuplotes crassus]|uniref:Uncharacterized protein n=1 Tax=Euplotes crassus TaxID=5936 RepID=A0AAD1XZ42_EUPCR|nr:unnamed protein product [Moneuplotes crassus]
MFARGQYVVKTAMGNVGAYRRISRGVFMNSSLMRAFSSLSKPTNASYDSSLDCADAFPMHSIIPEDLVRELVQKKRMKKLSENDTKSEANLAGIFPEIVFDRCDDITLT